MASTRAYPAVTVTGTPVRVYQQQPPRWQGNFGNELEEEEESSSSRFARLESSPSSTPRSRRIVFEEEEEEAESPVVMQPQQQQQQREDELPYEFELPPQVKPGPFFFFEERVEKMTKKRG